MNNIVKKIILNRCYMEKKMFESISYRSNIIRKIWPIMVHWHLNNHIWTIFLVLFYWFYNIIIQCMNSYFINSCMSSISFNVLAQLQNVCQKLFYMSYKNRLMPLFLILDLAWWLKSSATQKNNHLSRIFRKHWIFLKIDCNRF